MHLMRWMTAAATVVILALGGIGFLHTPAGRKLPIGRKILSWMGINCPIDLSRLTPERVEASRQLGVRALRGDRVAPAHPSLAGLELNASSEIEAQAWARARGISCVPMRRGMRFLKCANVAPSLLREDPGKSPIHMLTLAFDPRDQLVAVDVFRKKLAPEEATALLTGLSSRLQARLGHPSEKIDGSSTGTTVVNFRFRDYLAMLTVTHLPWSEGAVVHEQYSSITDPKASTPAAPKAVR